MARQEIVVKITTYMPDNERDAIFRNMLREKLSEAVAVCNIFSAGGKAAQLHAEFRTATTSWEELHITEPEDVDAQLKDELDELLADT